MLSLTTLILNVATRSSSQVYDEIVNLDSTSIAVPSNFSG